VAATRLADVLPKLVTSGFSRGAARHFSVFTDFVLDILPIYELHTPVSILLDHPMLVFVALLGGFRAGSANFSRPNTTYIYSHESPDCPAILYSQRSSLQNLNCKISLI